MQNIIIYYKILFDAEHCFNKIVIIGAFFACIESVQLALGGAK